MSVRMRPAAYRKIHIDGVGDVMLERSRRAMHVNLSVRSVKGIRVAVPYGVSFELAEQVALARAGWIRKHLARMEQMRREAETLEQVRPIDFEQDALRLICRLEELACRHAFTYNKVRVKNQKTRWGSCSAKNNINLNINLARLPEELMDYAILHELVHTRIKHHGRLFWLELDRLLGHARLLDKHLNRYGLLLR